MIDKRNALLISSVLIIFFVVGFYIPYEQTKRRPRPAVPEKGGQHMTVRYTNTGFEPATITIKASTTVEWVNVSDKLMWVASNPHPSHTDLPGFDESGIEGNVLAVVQGMLPTASAHTAGGEYRYTFTTTGTWGYHNHLVPSDRGIVIVEKQF